MENLRQSMKNQWTINEKTMKNRLTSSMENLRKINEKIHEKSMKIRWKIVQNRAWRCVGPSWGLLGCLVGILERLGNILGASWERLGASWGRSGGIPEREGDPTWTPGWPKIVQKSIQNRIDFWSIFRCDLDPKMVTEWLPKPSKSGPKKCSIFDRFLHRFLDRSWWPKSLKMSTSCTREAHFHKIAFSDSDIFLEATITKKDSQNGTNMA